MGEVGEVLSSSPEPQFFASMREACPHGHRRWLHEAQDNSKKATAEEGLVWMTQDKINPRVVHLCFVQVSTCSYVLENVVIFRRNEFSIQTVRYSLLSYFW